MASTNIPPKYRGEFLRCVVGSEVFGLSQGGSDLDLMGICLEPADRVIGLGSFEQHIYRSQPEGARSGAGDVDCTVYGLRKFLRLATKGNPTILTLFFVPAEFRLHDEPLAQSFRDLAPSVLSRQAAGQFLGYMTAQKQRLLGERGGAHTNRPELVEKFGFDVKYAMHMTRLGMQGVELLSTGHLSMPLPEPNRSYCLAIRNGEVELEEVLTRVGELETELSDLRTDSPLQANPDIETVNEFLYEAYTTFWANGS